MKILFYQPHSNRDTSDTDAWLRGLQQALPQAGLREWQPGDRASADYAVVWRPPRELFAGRHDLRAIFNLGAGVDAILGLERDFPGTLPRDALLVRLEDTGMGQQMVEYIAYAVLRYLRRFDEYEQLQRARRWKVLEPHPRATFTVGVMGLGVLGTQVAQALAALGLPVRGFSRNAKRIEGIACSSGELHGAAFDAFLDGVKVLVNLLPHTPDTADVLNARTFSKLARGAYLVNVARGGHLVEHDLIEALAHGQIAAATLDVFREEPLPADHPFWSEPRLTITPHSAAQTLRDESIEQVAQKIASLARGEPISGVVERARGY